MNKYFCIPIFTFLLTHPIFGQSNECGTYLSPQQITLENTLTLSQAKPNESLPLINRTLSITVYIVRDNTFDPSVLPDVINKLNAFFEPISLRFNICAINYVENHQFNDLYKNKNEKDLVVQNSEKNTINLYLVQNLHDETGFDIAGFTYMPADAGKNYIFLSKSVIQGTSLAHQIGHFLGLYDTHEYAFGRELVNESNCTTTGDKCCDTNADPDLSRAPLYNCTYTDTISKDANNAHYIPPLKNLMSFSERWCRCNFTNTQFLRMVYFLNNYRKDLR